MDLDQIPLLALIKGKLGYDSQRQRVISQNVANADTPAFSPTDMQAFRPDKAMGRSMDLAPVNQAITNVAHLAAPGPPKSVWTTTSAPDSETTLDGNQVVLEEQMMKMTEAKMDYDAAVTLYQQSLGLLKLAIRRPGGGV